VNVEGDGIRTLDDGSLRALLRDTRNIAVVGLSSKPWRDSFRVAGYLQHEGYRIVPVNPNESEVLGEPAYPSLSEVPDRIDLVDVFRQADYTPAVAREAVQVGAKTLWLQLGIVSEEAGRIAVEGGLSVIMGICLMTEHRRLRP
jgi:uncharacterized protein